MKSEPKTTLTLHREGTFTVRNIGQHWCGTTEIQDIRYTVDVVCDTSLDDRGFLFDQLTVATFFAKTTTCADSCERFTILIARALYILIKSDNRGCQVKSLKLTLSPAPYAASMTLTYSE